MGCDGVSLGFVTAGNDQYLRTPCFSGPDDQPPADQLGLKNADREFFFNQPGPQTAFASNEVFSSRHQGRSMQNAAAPDPLLSVMPDLQFQPMCTCIPSCTSKINWVAPWCAQNLDQTTLSKIKDANVFSIPSKETIDSLLRYYFQYKHPRLPVLSEWTMYCLLEGRPVAGEEMAAPLSLALLYAILFSASSMIREDELLRTEFSSIRAMGNAFYTRSKVRSPQTFFNL